MRPRRLDQPPISTEACGGCFLFERRGVCPMAQDAYGLQNTAEAHHRADVLHTAVLRDAGTVPSLGELVRLEAHQYPAGLAAACRLGLLAALPADPVPDSRKEIPHVAVPRALR